MGCWCGVLAVLSVDRGVAGWCQCRVCDGGDCTFRVCTLLGAGGGRVARCGEWGADVRSPRLPAGHGPYRPRVRRWQGCGASPWPGGASGTAVAGGRPDGHTRTQPATPLQRRLLYRLHLNKTRREHRAISPVTSLFLLRMQAHAIKLFNARLPYFTVTRSSSTHIRRMCT